MLSAHTLNQVFLVTLDGPERKLVVRVARPGGQHVFWGDSKAKYRSEAAAMVFARDALSGLAHVPAVVASGVDQVSDLPYLVMECVDGVSLRAALKSGLVDSRSAAERILRLVRHMCDLAPPHVRVGSFGGPDCGLFFDGPDVGACATVADFMGQLIVWSAERARQEAGLAELLLRAKEEMNVGSARLVFRHGDLSIDNVMVGRNEELALIDWEFCGVCDERDVWLETRELLTAMGQEATWREAVPIAADELEHFERCKEIAMGMSWAAVAKTEEDRQEEVDILRDNLESLLKAKP